MDLSDRLIEAEKHLNLVAHYLRELSTFTLTRQRAGPAEYQALVAKVRAHADQFKRLTDEIPHG
jgi:hypothetical protein